MKGAIGGGGGGSGGGGDGGGDSRGGDGGGAWFKSLIRSLCQTREAEKWIEQGRRKIDKMHLVG